MNKILLITGMHRSGTSLVTLMAEKIGGRYAGDLMAADEWNPTGYGESIDVYNINQKILDKFNRDWYDFMPLQEGWENSSEMSEITGNGIDLINKATSEKNFGGDNILLIKDPRLCFLMSYWDLCIEKSNSNSKIILMIRHPWSVAESIYRRDGINREIVFAMWISSYWGAYNFKNKISSLIFFDDLLRNPKGVIEKIVNVAEIYNVLGDDKIDIGINEALKLVDLSVPRNNTRKPIENNKSCEIYNLAVSIYNNMTDEKSLNGIGEFKGEIELMQERLRNWYPHWRELYVKYSFLLNGMRGLNKQVSRFIGDVSLAGQ